MLTLRRRVGLEEVRRKVRAGTLNSTFCSQSILGTIRVFFACQVVDVDFRPRVKRVIVLRVMESFFFVIDLWLGGCWVRLAGMALQEVLISKFHAASLLCANKIAFLVMRNVDMIS